MVSATVTTPLMDSEAEQAIKKATQLFEDTMRNIIATALSSEQEEIKGKDEQISALESQLKELKTKYKITAITMEGNSDVAARAMMHLAEGKRHLIVKDIAAAVECLEKACSAFAEKFGETADECGESYFYYGSALLELARLETGVIKVADGDSNGEVESKDNESKPEEIEEDIELEKMEESTDDVEDTKDDAEAKKDEADVDDMENGEPTDVEGNEAVEADAAEEEVTNLQLSWEVLELARNIFYRQSKKCTEMENKLAETYLKLGEVSLESENYSQSIDDFCLCLFIRQKNFTPDDRKIAEVHYQLGNSYTFDKQYMKGKVQYDLSLKVLNKRIHKLKEAITARKDCKHAPVAKADEFYTEEGEIEEIGLILRDISEKIADMEDLEKELKHVATLSPRLEKAIRNTVRAVSSLATEMRDTAQAKILEFGEGSSCNTELEEKSSVSKTLPAKPSPTDISHLVKRKRDSLNGEEESVKATATKSPTLKKVKVADEKVLTNGTEAKVIKEKALTNGTTNGVAVNADA